jgi:phage terminase Nu1 subunit (DNA packaging protein)
MSDIVLPVHLGHSTDDKGNTDKRIYQGAEAIAKTFGVSRRTVLRWKRAGAPIYKLGGRGGTKYQCQYAELWAWIRKNEKKLYLKKPVN